MLPWFVFVGRGRLVFHFFGQGALEGLVQTLLDVVPVLTSDANVDAEHQGRRDVDYVVRPSVVTAAFVHVVVGGVQHQVVRCGMFDIDAGSTVDAGARRKLVCKTFQCSVVVRLPLRVRGFDAVLVRLQRGSDGAV